MSLSRTTASKLTSKISIAGAVIAGAVALGATPALAAKAGEGKPASAKVNAELAVCPGQTFSQPFEALGDSNYYTLVEGSAFNGSEAGWELHDGAQVLETTRPDGTSGGVLDMPSGAVAISPPVCVTLQYPSARAWVQEPQQGASASVLVGVYYAGGRLTPVGALSARPGRGWEVSSTFEVKPELGGSEEGVREVRFVYANTSRGDVRLWGLYVDPRMS